MRFLAAAVFLLLVSPAFAVDCPSGAKQCKVLIVTPEEEQVLTQQNGIFEMAEWAFRPLGQAAKYWREKLATAPAGNTLPTAPVVVPAPEPQK